MSMQDWIDPEFQNQVIATVIQFLQEGDEHHAAEILQSCSIEFSTYEYEDGWGEYSLTILFLAPRAAYDILSDEKNVDTKSIRRAFEATTYGPRYVSFDTRAKLLVDESRKYSLDDLRIMLVRLRTGLLSYASDRTFATDEYQELRRKLIANSITGPIMPTLIKTCKTLTDIAISLEQFGGSSFAEQKLLIENAFAGIEKTLESKLPPVHDIFSTKAGRMSLREINEAWLKALERRNDDPDGAITAARSLIESTCKFILHEKKIEYDLNADLPKLYQLVASQLNLSPSQHEEKLFKQILGCCQQVVEGIGAVRNRLSDAHGKSPKTRRPARRHAELAVNLAGSMSCFLLDTWEFHSARRTENGDSEDLPSDQAKARSA